MIRYEVREYESGDLVEIGSADNYNEARKEARSYARREAKKCYIWYSGEEYNTRNGYRPVRINDYEEIRPKKMEAKCKIESPERTTEGRTQYLKFRLNGGTVQAGRVLITSDRFSPWIITEGREILPENHGTRGRLLSAIYEEKESSLYTLA